MASFKDDKLSPPRVQLSYIQASRFNLTRRRRVGFLVLLLLPDFESGFIQLFYSTGFCYLNNSRMTSFNDNHQGGHLSMIIIKEDIFQ
ncbi:hypothetical protein CEXT_190591 [Caerostris extrusa]|uniref:Uncharacterized protein n=1 Tax=Caerostris extrusa TaxID=172846 RepID=A0AAV4MHE3_CAEEX|nr:hypothetical protein CEXT_190591 [Caerostris extrusa]